MVDIPGNATTTTTIAVGNTVNGTLEAAGDHDWYRINLTGGQLITVTLTGLTLADPYLRIRDAAGKIIFENDDINLGVDTDSRISFEVPSSGIYYIDTGAFDDGDAGTFQLSVQNYSPPPVWTTDQVANYLTTGFWGGKSRAFDVTQGESLTVNISALTAAGQNFAVQALALWTDIIGVTFNVVATGGQIVFDDNEDGAFAESTYGGGFITSSHVNVDVGWLSYYGTGTNSYAFQTYIHEIGHALGLGHAGPYNGTGDYFSQALFANDGWPTSVMSYFSQNDGSYFDNLGFTYAFAVSPMMADIAAMQQLYGLSTTTRTGNTTYGFNSTAGNPIFNAGLNPNVAFTIYDSGGTDTLNYSNYNGAQLINLNQETFSNVNGKVGTVSIGRGTVIENAIGGGGADTIIGNSTANQIEGNGGNDTITGGGGIDKFIFDSGDGQDTITDLAAGEKVQIGGYAAAQSVTQSGANVIVVLSATDRITFQNTTVAAVQASLVFGNAVPVGPTEGNDILNGTEGVDLINALGGNDTIFGLGGNDTLNGGTGADILKGGAGDDSYYVDDAGDIVSELAGEGTDTVYSSVSFSLWSEVDNLTLTGTAITGGGNNGANTIIGNAQNNVLNGAGGADILKGAAGDDSYYVDDAGDQVSEIAGEGTDTVYSAVSFSLWSEVDNLTLTGTAITGGGNNGANTIIGNAQNNVLNGAGGADILKGAAGDDIYYVDDAGDIVSEIAGEGIDTVYSSLSFSLWSEVDNLTLTGTAITGGGNNGANTIIGNAQNNVLNGAGGADILKGAAGNDIYYVDDAGDIVSEIAGEGIDTVYSSVNFSLWAEVDNLTLTGTAITGGGNNGANTIIGNAQNNVLNGAGGADILKGAGGNDIYYVDDAGDIVSEIAGEGTDTVYSSVSFTLWSEVENLTLTGAAATNGSGNNQNNVIAGNGAANIINGAGGNDTLLGGGGADSFLFNSVLNSATNVDQLNDFSVTDDTIVLDDDIFTALSTGALSGGAFRTGAAAADADDRIIYDSATGNIYYDADGNGGATAVLFAHVAAGTALTSADFLVVA